MFEPGIRGTDDMVWMERNVTKTDLLASNHETVFGVTML